jgi:hypothetical protein
VAADVAIESGGFPVPVGIRARLEAGLGKVGSEQTIRVHCQQVIDVPILRLAEGALEQAHLPQREVLHGLDFQADEQETQADHARRGSARSVPDHVWPPGIRISPTRQHPRTPASRLHPI